MMKVDNMENWIGFVLFRLALVKNTPANVGNLVPEKLSLVTDSRFILLTNQ